MSVVPAHLSSQQRFPKPPPAPAFAGMIPPLQTWGDPIDRGLSWQDLMSN